MCDFKKQFFLWLQGTANSFLPLDENATILVDKMTIQVLESLKSFFSANTQAKIQLW